MPDPAIEIESLEVVRGGNQVVRSISLAIEAGTITGLLGPSGCGKTTLMRSIVGAQITAAGRVKVLGREAGSRELRPLVGYVTQAPSVYGDLTVQENLEYFGRVVGAPGARATETIGTVGLSDYTDRLVASLSGGERARVSLASALLNRPRILILDEPTVGLDPVLRAELWRDFRELADGGVTLLVSSHVMDEAGECDDLLLMREGRLLRQCAPDELRRETGQQDLGRAFLKVIEMAGRS
ncbi:MAG: ABC transporter ATP-binding protein [Solirubrobacterales bacterium]|nr:ABC transporter ATP-binding protein [Solirubrobacterales bacterium]